MHWFGRIPSIFVLSLVLAASATPVPQAVASDLNPQELSENDFDDSFPDLSNDDDDSDDDDHEGGDSDDDNDQNHILTHDHYHRHKNGLLHTHEHDHHNHDYFDHHHHGDDNLGHDDKYDQDDKYDDKEKDKEKDKDKDDDNEVGLDGDNGFGPNNDWDQDRLINDVECPVRPACVDSDGDGFVNYRDRDDDNDGIETRKELTDLDLDSVSDHLEPNHWDFDEDGYYNHNDDDDDGDGKPTKEEVGPDALYPIDADGDYVPDYLDPDDTNNANTPDGTGDSDGDGLSDKEECAAWPCIDTDYDDLPNYLDVDDDGDGILTQDELGDTDQDGVRDSLEPNTLNTDGENTEDIAVGGVTNINDPDDDGDGTPTADEVGNPILPIDHDADGIPDYVDVDTANDANTLDASGDSDEDGHSDINECAYGPCPDTDSDNVPNYNDPDDDNDGINTIDEKGDSDKDTVPDYLEPNNQDLDQDGVNNYLDPDDDGDGINTIDEVGSNPLRPIDTNENDIPDYLEYTPADSLLDSDGDGIPDVQECPQQPCVDTDGDGDANAFDPDDDNDTTPTSEERSRDEDGDRVPDHLEPNNRDLDGDGQTNQLDADDDNDGIPTQDELGPDYLYPSDVDNDLIPDYLDADSNNDAGTVDGTGDSDGDGFSDGQECPTRPCADDDFDGVPNYFDPDTAGIVDRNLGDEGGASEDLVILTNTAVPEGGALGITMGAGLMGLFLLRRRRNKIQVTQCLSVGCLPLLLSLSSIVQADLWPLSHFNGKKAAETESVEGEAVSESEVEAENTQERDTSKGWQVYGGGALGISKLSPETNNTGYSVTDDSDAGYKVFGGVRISERIQFETSFNRLGSSQVAFNTGQAAAIDYDVFSFDVLYRLPEIVDVPFHSFGILGLTALDNDSTVRVEKDAAVQIKSGVALEYPMKNEWALRGTVEKFSGDTAFFSAGVVKYFGEEDRNAGLKIASALTSAISNAGNTSLDSDGDGVPDNLDKCPDTLPGLKVDKDGCGIFNRTFSSITFKNNSTELTTQARGVLDGLALELKKVPRITVEVQAHTDDIGTGSYNVWLSTKRAEAIISYLVTRGIADKRLKPRGYGETKPVASNNTDEGRAQNRRAEFHIIE